MNPFCEKDESLTSRTHVVVPSKGEVTAVASNNVRHRKGILESTRIDYGYEDMGTCRKSNASVQSYPICLHKHINKENARGRESAVERLHWERSSSTVAISGGSSNVSGKESHKDPVAGESHQQGSSAFESPQRSDSKWNSGSGPLTDTPPLHPHNHHGISRAECASPKECHKDPSGDEPRRGSHNHHGISRAECASPKECHKDPGGDEPRRGSSIRRLQQSGDSRWSSGYRASDDMAPSQALARGRMILRPSSVSAVNDDAVEMKNRATLFERRRRCRRVSDTPQRSSVCRFHSFFGSF
jgi:hypothetical protein